MLDTNIILNDFFYRQPDYGFQRTANQEQAKEVELYRQTVNEALLFLSLKPTVEVFTTSAIVSRFASVLGDLLVPASLVFEEISYWLSNVKLLELQSKNLQNALNKMEMADPKFDFDDYLLKLICEENGIDLLLTSIPKSRQFYWPILVFKPEKIREICFEDLESLPRN